MFGPGSVRTHLIGLVGAIVVPLLGFSAFLVIRAAEHEQDAMAMAARNRTRIVAAAIDDQIGSFRARLFLLAGSLNPPSGALDGFHARAAAAFDPLPVILSDTEGHERLDSSKPLTEPLPDHPDRDAIAQAVSTGRPYIGHLVPSGLGGFVLPLNLPVGGDGPRGYVLSMDLLPILPRLLSRLDLPDGWVATIVDRNGVIAARTRDPDRYLGKPAREPFLRRIQIDDEGWIEGLSREGVPLFTAFAHTRLGDWTIGVGVPRDILLAPVHQTIRDLVLLGGTVLLLAGVLAAVIGRRIADPVEDLVPVAEAVGHGEAIAHVETGPSEVRAVFRALAEASARLLAAARDQAEAADALRASESRYRALAEDLARIDNERSGLLSRMAAVQEEERKRVARELHDSLAQYLTALHMRLDALRQALSGPARNGAASAILTDVKTIAADLGLAVNRLAWELRPVALDDLGLESAVRHYLEEWSDRARLPVQAEINVGIAPLPPLVEMTLFRILQEATANVMRHAGARTVGVILEADGAAARLIVEDDGRGFSTDPDLQASGRFGLQGMRERVAMVGGTLDVETAPDQGTTLFIHVPLTRTEALS